MPIDPVPVISNLGVHPGTAVIRAKVSPRYDPGQPTPNGQGPTGVPPAGIPAARAVISGAHLALGQAAVPIVHLIAPRLVDNRHADALDANGPTVARVAPAGHGRAVARLALLRGVEQPDRLPGVVEDEGLRDLDQGDVVDGDARALGVKALVQEDSLGLVDTAGLGLERRAGPDAQELRWGRSDALGRGDEVVGRDDGAGAEVAAVELEGDLEGVARDLGVLDVVGQCGLVGVVGWKLVALLVQSERGWRMDFDIHVGHGCSDFIIGGNRRRVLRYLSCRCLNLIVEGVE